MTIDAPIAEYLRPPSATETNLERLSLCLFSLPAHGAANLTLYFVDSIGQCGI